MRATRGICGGALALAALVIGGGAQTAPKPAADAGSAGGFSIETEMLTYRALESNSEAIGCDIAAWLNGATADFNHPPQGAVCNAGASSGPQGRIVLLPFDKAQLANFQIWRADMATMQRLQQTAEDLRGAAGGCVAATPPVSQGAEPGPGAIAPRSAAPASGAEALSAAGSFLSMTPAGPPLALAQSVLGLLASDRSASSVAGTIKDQAFMDGVARELRTLKVQVVMPSSYAPGTLGTLDEQSSPFLHNRMVTLRDRECLSQMTTNPAAAAIKAEVEQTMAEIDAFLVSLGEGAAASDKPKAAAAGATTPGATPAPSAAPAASTSAGAHLAADLDADGLAQLLGVDPDSGQLPAMPRNYVLLVQALESGGTVEKSTNVLGSRYHYSGGSVGTYALFSTAGDLECSGNVYDYAGSLKAKQFGKAVQGFKPNPQGQTIFLHSCSGVKTGIQ